MVGGRCWTVWAECLLDHEKSSGDLGNKREVMRGDRFVAIEDGEMHFLAT